MNAAHCRIASVRMKSGGAKFHIIHNKDHDAAHKWIQADALSAVKSQPGMAGYAIVAWSRDRGTFVKFYVWDGSFIQAAQVPQFAKDALMVHYLETRE